MAESVESLESVEDVLEREVPFTVLVAETQHLGQPEGRREHRANLLFDADLDALRDRDLALARQQRNLPHLAQVDAHGIVARSGVLVFAGVVAGSSGGTRARTRRLDHLDVVVAKERQHLIDLVGGHHFGECAVHLLDRQESLATSFVE